LQREVRPRYFLTDTSGREYRERLLLMGIARLRS
jgi:hypothetical protein